MPDAELAPYDVIIVGAGLSGIGAACNVCRACPAQRLLLLEGRECSGGTWDLFRYPGVRSDSDMYTLGYSFKPWTEDEAIAEGPSILRYIRETAHEHAVDELIHYRRRVRRRLGQRPEVLVAAGRRYADRRILGLSRAFSAHVQWLLQSPPTPPTRLSRPQ